MKDIENGKSDKALKTLNEYISNNDTSESTKTVLKEIKDTLEKRIATQGKPIKNAPHLQLFYACGSKIYGDTVYLVFLMIPVVPIRRYSLELSSTNSYRFFGELKLHFWQKAWQWGMALFSTWYIAKTISS